MGRKAASEKLTGGGLPAESTDKYFPKGSFDKRGVCIRELREEWIAEARSGSPAPTRIESVCPPRELGSFKCFSTYMMLFTGDAGDESDVQMARWVSPKMKLVYSRNINFV